MALEDTLATKPRTLPTTNMGKAEAAIAGMGYTPEERTKIQTGFEAKESIPITQKAEEMRAKAGESAAAAAGARETSRLIESDPLTGQIKEATEKRNKPFVPTQETSKDLMNLFTLTTVIGFALGGAGKAHAQQAVSAMNGMLEGHIKGRDDLYKREKDIYEENMKSLDKIIATLTNERTFNVENYKLKGTAMADERKQAVYETGATNISKLLDKTGDVATGEFLKQVVEMNNKRKEHEANLYKEAMKEDKQLQRTREEIASREKVATMPQREAPKEVVVTMKDGSKTYGTMLAGQIQFDGKPVDRSEVKNVNLVSGESKAGMGGVGQIQFRYNGALASASNRLSTHVENFHSILQSSAPPGLGQVITSERTVPTAVLKYLGASITDVENRAFQQQLAPLIREVAVVESAGRPGGMTESAIKEYQQMAPVGGDNKISTYLFLALVKQEAEFAKDSLEASGGTPEQMNIAQRGLDKINKVVTWDVNDINRILRGTNGKQLVSPKIEQMLTHSNSLEEFSNQMTASKTPTAGQWTVTEK